MSLRKHFDVGSLVVMAITLVLFVGAVFATGLTHDLLLEAGVFLVSVKLILMAYKASVTAASLEQKLEDIRATLARVERAAARGDGPLGGVEARDYESRKPLP